MYEVPLIRLFRCRRGLAVIVGSILFLVILLFFFTNVFLWHDQATRQMDSVVTDKVNSIIEVIVGWDDSIPVPTYVVNVTNRGGVGCALSRLWIDIRSGEQNGDHVYADLENVEGLWLSAGATIELHLNSDASGPYVSPVNVDTIDLDGVVLYEVQYAPNDGDVFKVLTNLGNSEDATLVEYELSVSTVGGGSVSLNNTGPYFFGDVVELTAVADLGWSFSGWSGDLSDSNNPESITMDGDKTVTATFIQNEYSVTVTVAPSEGGFVSPDTSGVVYYYGDVVTLTPTANPGYSFVGWSGDGVDGTGNTREVTVTGDMDVTASFIQDQYALTVNVVGSGSVSKNPDQATYVYGDVVELTAVPDVGWTFAGWTGDLAGNVNPETLLMDGSKTVTATFTEDQYALTVNVVGNGSVSKDPDQATYTYGTVVELDAVADPGWTFQNWTGDLSGNNDPESITIDGDKVVNATFTLDEYLLNLTIVGDGIVALNYTGPYNYGDWVELDAVADPGWTFQNWTGDLSGSNASEVLLMDGNKVVNATFTLDEYLLNLTIVGDGIVALNYTGPYNYGDWVELDAVADPGWTFDGWSGNLTGLADPEYMLVTGNMTVNATFIQDQYTLTVNVIGNGSVVLSPNQPFYVYGDVVELTAVADVGWSFSGWSGNLSSSNNPESLTIDGNMTVNATFTQDQYTLTINVVGSGSVSKNPDQATYVYDDVVELTAVADVGWSFSGWSGDLSGINNPETITMDDNKAVTATFTL